LVFSILSPQKTLEFYLQSGAKTWAKLLLRITGITVIVEKKPCNRELRDKSPMIVVSNHNSVIDILVLLYVLPFPCVFFSKRSIFLVPGYGWYMWWAGHISVNRKSPRNALESLKSASVKLKNNTSVIIFPEGSRSENGILQPFKSGFSRIAGMCNAPVLPVSIKGTEQIIRKGSIMLHPERVIVNIGKPYPNGTSLYSDNSTRSKLVTSIHDEIDSMMKAS